jgi:hypothetical protein
VVAGAKHGWMEDVGWKMLEPGWGTNWNIEISFGKYQRLITHE